MDVSWKLIVEIQFGKESIFSDIGIITRDICKFFTLK